MTDADAPDQDAPTTGTIPDRLLALQAVDTEDDQLAHRREHSVLRDEFVDAVKKTRLWETTRDEFAGRIDELGAAIESAEQRGAELLTHRERLEGQLKTVIAPREAEALMHEITTIGAQIDELDVRELEALEEQSSVDTLLDLHLRIEDRVRAELRTANDALVAEQAAIDERRGELTVRRGELRSELTAALLATYDRKRAALGVAVAPLRGNQCQGCFMELSPAEIDTVKEEAAETGVADCPDCGRLLIVST